MMFRLIVRGRRAVIPLESNGRILRGEATTVEYRGFGFAVFVSDLSLDTAVFGVGSEISNFFGARGRGVGGSGDGVIDKSGKRLSCSLELNEGVVQDIELACVITGLFVSARIGVCMVRG